MPPNPPASFAPSGPCDPSDPFGPPPRNVADARALIGAIEARLAARGLVLRPPPPEPTACCGRGCSGCVWQGYYAALLGWRDAARNLLFVKTGD